MTIASGWGVVEGDLVDDRFRVGASLGSGGHGVVVAARDEFVGDDVALKLLRRGSDVRAARRWARETESLRAVEHPNLVRFVAAGDHGPGLHYLAMRRIEGRSLGELHAAAPRPSQVRIADRIDEVLAALGSLHRRGLVHRDVKPANVLVEGAGDRERAVLVDLGLVHLAEGDESWSRLTRSGAVVGTVEYLAPERAHGDPGDARADLWSVGVMLHELLTGTVPFRAKSATKTLLQIVGAPMPALATGLPARDAIAALLRRALAKAPRDRFPDADAFRDALARIRPALSSRPSTSTHGGDADDATCEARRP